MQNIEQRAKYLTELFTKAMREKNIQEAFSEIAWHIAALEMQMDEKEGDEVIVVEE